MFYIDEFKRGPISEFIQLLGKEFMVILVNNKDEEFDHYWSDIITIDPDGKKDSLTEYFTREIREQKPSSMDIYKISGNIGVVDKLKKLPHASLVICSTNNGGRYEFLINQITSEVIFTDYHVD